MNDWRKEVKKDSPFLYYFDIEDASPVEVEMVGYEQVEAFCPGKKKKGMLWSLKFKGAKKMLGVNVTNGNLIEHVTGTADKDKWVGKRIILRVATCDGEKCIRVHAPGAKLPAQCKRFDYVDADPGKSKTGSKVASPHPATDPGEEVASEPVSNVSAGEDDVPESSPGLPDKRTLAYLKIVTDTEAFGLDEYREVKEIYLRAQLPWQKKWDLLVQSKEWHVVIPAMVKALKEACDG